MWNKIFLSIGLLFSLAGISQETIEGTVTDAQSGKPIEAVHVVVKGTSVQAFTNANGRFALDVPAGKDELVFARFGYLFLEAKAAPKLAIALEPEIQQLGAAEVQANPKRESIDTGSPTMAVIDYAFYDHLLIVLGRDHVGNTTTLRVLGEEDRILASHTLDETATELVTDCTGNVHLLTDTQAYQLYFDYQDLHLIYPVNLGTFYTIVAPCLAQAFDHVFVHRESYMGLRAEIWAAGVDSTFCLNRHEDQEAITYLHREYDLNYYLAIRRRGEGYMFPVDVLIDNLEYFHENQSYDLLDRHIIAPPRIDVARLGSNLTIWNWGTDSLEVFNRKFERVHTQAVPLRDARLLSDPNGTALYLSQENNGLTTLFALDPQLEVAGKWKLNESPHASRVNVRAGIAYFLDKDPSDARGFRLYRKRLN